MSEDSKTKKSRKPKAVESSAEKAPEKAAKKSTRTPRKKPEIVAPLETTGVPAPSVPEQHSASNGRIRVFNIYYREEQRAQLDGGFIPYDNSENTSHLLEFDVFRGLYGSEPTRGADYWGALSWKFHQKTGLTAQDLNQVIETNPGYDCYFCNPHPEVESIYHNIWIQGETAHPNFLRLAVEFFKAADLDVKLLSAVFPAKYFAAANFFVANDHFWKAYIDFINEVVTKAEARLPLRIKQAMYSSAADPRSAHVDAGYWPFFIERLFSIFLVLNRDRFKVLKFGTKSKMLEANVHHKLLLQMKDTAWQQKSNWLAVCWVNYRNLYLDDLYGKNWMKKNVEAITPKSVIFA